ncbi:MAG: valine--tRNA ligase [Patescibacteria group bacterium]
MLDKVFKPAEVEEKIYQMWEEGGYFTPKIDPLKKPFTILLPPPNASGKMHVGNIFMIALEDLMIRWHRMKGEPALYVPGTDHAGFETQITFERELKKDGKSRFQFDRQTLYKHIQEFVQKNQQLVNSQIRRLGASVDWTRYRFTLDPQVLQTVFSTFKKMYEDGLVYRSNYLVNYCPVCGTTFADLEVLHEERVDPLYYIKYGPFSLATVRPETKFGDTAVAVNPKDKRYKDWIGKEIEVEGLLGKFRLKVIGDSFVDPKFGTGVVKITPAHDKNDFEAGRRHNLAVIPTIDLHGRLNEKCGKYAGLKVKEARKIIVEDLKSVGLLEKVDETYTHNVTVCYKGGHDIEPTILPNWFVKVASLKEPAVEVVKNGKVKILPKRFEKTYYRWMEQMYDWPISRQVVWGIRIPVWYNVLENPEMQVEFLDKDGARVTATAVDALRDHTFGEIESGLQRISAPIKAVFKVALEKPGENFLQETDTFDTWFSSGQWPLVTMGYPDSEDFKYFYPTSVLETGWEILRFWVSRMIMFGLYRTGEAPFETVYLHGLVRALDGRKMSKSLGNIIEPDSYIAQYGVDALRMGLVVGSAAGKDLPFPRDKVIGFRNFGNKLWNIARFVLGEYEKFGKEVPFYSTEMSAGIKLEDKEIIKSLNSTINMVDGNLKKFRFAKAGEGLYQFVWHEFADVYLEKIKPRLYEETKISDEDRVLVLSVLRHILLTSLKLLHPFMPFVTEAIWQQLPRKHNEPLIISAWPKGSRN